MDADDAQVGRLLSRREVLALFGAAGAALLVACAGEAPAAAPASVATQAPAGSSSGTVAAAAATAVPACVVVPALTEGPYFVDEKINRSDIRSDPSTGAVKAGSLLTLTFNVGRVSGNACTPLEGATFDIWHCDALGVYSDTSDPGFNTVGQKFLRGYQVTNAAGRVQFTTIYPGWYQGRATHIHFKVRTGNAEFTSQFFFDDTLSDQVHVQGAYAQKGASGRLQNARDNIYQQSNGLLTLNVERAAEGYAASFDIGIRI
jgi:protocatechuate 3,4-dioxygenase beta subunit